MPVMRIGTVTLAVALAARPASAQTPRLHESVVVSGASEPIPFENVARTVWVLTRDDIVGHVYRGRG